MTYYYKYFKTRFLLFALVISTMVLPASAYDFMTNGLCYNINDDGKSVTITHQHFSSPRYTSLSGALAIPSTVTYNGKTYSVTNIGVYAFFDCTDLTDVTIPNSVTNISLRAFMGCNGLTSVTIPNSVTNIGDWAFYNCSGLTNITIPNSVTSIGNSAFSDCSGLTSVTIPNSVINIGEDAFFYCSGLTSVTIPNSVTSIGDEAFANCSRLTSVTIPNSVTSIGSWMFQNCSGLTNVTIPSSVTSIGNWAFSNCRGLLSITIPNSVTSIGVWAFEGTPWFNNQPDGLVYAGLVAYEYKGTMPDGTSITLKLDTKGIADGCFSGCSGLTSVTIPNSVKSIGRTAFGGCSSLTTIRVENGNTVYDSRSGCNAIIETASNTLIKGCKNTAILNSITSIGDDAFLGCTGLTNITIPNSVTSIGYGAFFGCYGLTNITIPNSVISIGDQAFANCNGLTSVYSRLENPNNVILGDSVFDWIDKSSCKLHVPASSVDLYRKAEQWKDFKQILPITESNTNRKRR